MHFSGSVPVPASLHILVLKFIALFCTGIAHDFTMQLSDIAHYLLALIVVVAHIVFLYCICGMHLANHSCSGTLSDVEFLFL